MARTRVRALAAARPVILGLIFLNAFYALAIAGALGFSFFIQGWPERPLGAEMVKARRLEAIAWRVMVLEVMRLVIAAVAASVWESGRVAAFSLAPWLAVLLLFVLSGVFAQGTQMRVDLEGTV